MTENPKDSDLLGDIYEDQALPSPPALDEETPFATMMSSFDEAAQTVGVNPAEYQILRKCDREIAFSVPVRHDDGDMEVLDGFRIQHNAGLGPFLGPLRISSDMRIVELRPRGLDDLEVRCLERPLRRRRRRPALRPARPLER